MYCCKNNDPMKTAILSWLLLFTLTCYGQQPGEKLISTLGGVSHYSSTISKQYLLDHPVITAIAIPPDKFDPLTYEHNEYKVQKAIVSWQKIIESNGDLLRDPTIFEYRLNGNTFDLELITALRDVRSGSTILIEKIVAESIKDGSFHNLPSMTFILE